MLKKLIDTHVHIWDFEKADYDWLKNDESILNRNYSIDEFDEARVEVGITEAVLVQAANNFEDTDHMLEVAGDKDWVSGVVGWLPLMNPGQTLKALEDKYARNPFFKGIRHLVHDEPDPQWLLQDEVIESLKILSSFNLPFDVVAVLPKHIETAMEVANKVPGLKMVFDHISQPPISTKEKFGLWGQLMEEAANMDNFYVKVSGLGNTSKNFYQWTAADITPYIEFALEKFGSDRCFCGGNWPVSLLAESFTNTWEAYIKVISSLLDESQQEKVFYTNAQKFYHL
ncbi:MAG: amidohydrolase family protein [Ferruginibacter sp.]|nr:amidohydrolase family protein [Ferruginibacter sp.]